MAIVLISDVHLCADRPAVTELFLSFLEETARTSEGLYILGDLFDGWVGDDAAEPEDKRVLAGLRVLTDAGVPLWVMQGNHDFLYGAGFAAETGCRFLPDPYLLDHGGRRTVLTHGDLLCTNDVAYQHFRKVVRDPLWQAKQLAEPPAVRRALAKNLLSLSHTHTAEKEDTTMAVSQATVASFLRDQAATRLIHGHTHRPAQHRFWLDGQEVDRIVLPHWDVDAHGNATGGYVRCTPETHEIILLL